MIKNASTIKLNQATGTLPDVSGAMLNWFQKMTFIVQVQTVVNFQVIKTDTEISFQGVMQPFTDQQLQIKSTGERKWKWQTLHAETSLSLTPGEKVTYEGTDYRVMDKSDYSKYGYIKYELVEGYQ